MPKVSPEYLDNRRSEIVEAARVVFAAKGFARASMADLVEATGLSMGSLYRYFPSKDLLVEAVAEGRDGRVGGRYPEEPPDRLLARLIDYVSPASTDGREHAGLSAQIWGEAAVTPSLAEVARSRHAALRDHLAVQLARPRSPGAADRDRADALLAALIGYAALVAAGYPVDPKAFARTLAEFA